MKKLLVIFIIILSFHGLTAQKSEKKTYTLNECIDIALQNNLDIKLYEARLEQSGADLTYAFGQYLPSISINSGYTRQLNAKPGFTFVNGQLVTTDPRANSYDASIGANWLIFDGFYRDKNYQRAKYNYEANELNFKQIKQQVSLQIYQYFIDVIAKKQILKTRKANYELGKKEYERIKAQYEVGLIPLDVVYSQEADLANREYDIISSENSLNQAKANLLVLMGLNPEYDIEFLENSFPEEISEKEMNQFRMQMTEYKNNIEEAFNNRVDYQVIESQQKAYEASLSASYSGYYPRLSAYGGWYWSNFELNKFSELGRSSVGLNLSIPIFDQFQTNYRAQNAQLQLQQIQIEKSKLEQNIISSIKLSFLNLQAAEKQLEISNKALIAAEKSYQSFSEKFRIGSASITELLNANTQLINSKINRINAIYQYFRVQKELLYSLGLLN